MTTPPKLSLNNENVTVEDLRVGKYFATVISRLDGTWTAILRNDGIYRFTVDSDCDKGTALQIANSLIPVEPKTNP